MKTSKVRSFFLFALLAVLFLAGWAAAPSSVQAAARIGPRDLAAVPYGTGCSYYVRYGDTLSRIALRFRVSYFQLALMNALYNPNWIYVGERLNVPCGSSVPPSPNPGNYGVPICSYYSVQHGDWLKLIAARFGTTWTAIAKVNSISNPNLIYAGMRLAIPCG